MGGCQNSGPFFGYPIYEGPYYNRDPKRDHNFDNHPHALAANTTASATDSVADVPSPVALILVRTTSLTASSVELGLGASDSEMLRCFQGTQGLPTSSSHKCCCRVFFTWHAYAVEGLREQLEALVDENSACLWDKTVLVLPQIEAPYHLKLRSFGRHAPKKAILSPLVPNPQTLKSLNPLGNPELEKKNQNAKPLNA